MLDGREPFLTLEGLPAHEASMLLHPLKLFGIGQRWQVHRFTLEPILSHN